MTSGRQQQQQESVVLQQHPVVYEGCNDHDDDCSSLAIHKVRTSRTDFPFLPENIILGMCCAEHTVDIYDFMSKLLLEQSMTPGFSMEVLQHPDLAKLFRGLREDKGRTQYNPFWMSVGFIPSTEMWAPSQSRDATYVLGDMPNLDAMVKSAEGLYNRLKSQVTDDMKSMWSEMSQKSLKMVLAGSFLISRKFFPCMAAVSWGYANRRPVNKLVTRDEFGNSKSWAVPTGSTRGDLSASSRCHSSSLALRIGN